MAAWPLPSVGNGSALTFSMIGRKMTDRHLRPDGSVTFQPPPPLTLDTTHSCGVRMLPGLETHHPPGNFTSCSALTCRAIPESDPGGRARKQRPLSGDTHQPARNVGVHQGPSVDLMGRTDTEAPLNSRNYWASLAVGG